MTDVVVNPAAVLLVRGRANVTDVGEETRRGRVKASLSEKFVKFNAGSADEGFSALVFVLARGFADEPDRGRRPAFLN